MTWGEFKAAVEKQGVTDTDKLWYIDWHGDIDDDVNVDLTQSASLGVTIA
jgi:hypothetical protein